MKTISNKDVEISIYNKCVTIKHLPTGITVTSTDDVSQYRNKQRCLEMLMSRLGERK